MKIVIAAVISLILPAMGYAQDKKFNPNDLPPEKQREFYSIVIPCVSQAADANSSSEAATAAATACALNGFEKSRILKGIKLPPDFQLHILLAPPPSEDSVPDATPVSCPAPGGQIPT